MADQDKEQNTIIGWIFLGILAIIGWIWGIIQSLIGGRTLEKCKKKQDEIKSQLSEKQKESDELMDKLGNLELDVMDSFDDFANVLERFKERPDINKAFFNNKKLPNINVDEFHAISKSANAIKLAVRNVADGVVGCIATGGGVGMALTVLEATATGTGGTTGAALLSAITNGTAAQLSVSLLNPLLGIGFLAGGAIVFLRGFRLSSKAREAKREVQELQKKADFIINRLNNIDELSKQYYETMNELKSYYDINFLPVKRAVEEGRDTIKLLSREERLKLENSLLLADLLYKMCKIQFVKQSESEKGINCINEKEISSILVAAESMRIKLGVA